MKKMRRFLPFAVLALLLASLLAGCAGSMATGGGANSSAAAWEKAPEAEPHTVTEPYVPPMSPNETGEYDLYEGEPTIDEGGGYTGEDPGGTPSLTPPQDGRKVILNANLTIEALRFNEVCAAIEAAATEAGGCISGTNIYASGDYTDNRTADYTVKVPAENYSDFMSTMSETGNLVNRSETSEDITREYVDVEARLGSLRTQEARLLELMQQAASLEDLLTVQEQLTEVQYQIESFTATQRTYDELVAYSTVSIHVYEVSRTTETPGSGYNDRMGAAFRESWQNFVVFLQDFSIGFVYILPGLIVIAVILIVALLILRRVLKKRRNTPPPAYSGIPPVSPPPAQGAAPPAQKTNEKSPDPQVTSPSPGNPEHKEPEGKGPDNKENQDDTKININ